MTTELQVIEAAVPDALSTQAILAQVKLIHSVMKDVMIEDTHYGVIPGTGTKKTLLKAGAEKLLLTFRLDPQYESTEQFIGKDLFVRSKCTIYHQTSGRRMGSGEGSCSTMESKYAYRQGKRVCPECGKEAIIKGREEYGGGWLCFKKKGGCGWKWPDGAAEIESQSTERVPNDDVADQYNTVLKMANKRSLIAAVLNVTAASDIFTQDIGDNEKEENDDMPPPPPPLPKGAEMLAKIESKQVEQPSPKNTVWDPMQSLNSPHSTPVLEPTTAEVMEDMKASAWRPSVTTAQVKRELAEVGCIPPIAGDPQEYMTKLKLSESVREASQVGNEAEADKHLSHEDLLIVRKAVKARMVELGKKS